MKKNTNKSLTRHDLVWGCCVLRYLCPVECCTAVLLFLHLNQLLSVTVVLLLCDALCWHKDKEQKVTLLTDTSPLDHWGLVLSLTLYGAVLKQRMTEESVALQCGEWGATVLWPVVLSRSGSGAEHCQHLDVVHDFSQGGMGWVWRQRGVLVHCYRFTEEAGSTPRPTSTNRMCERVQLFKYQI